MSILRSPLSLPALLVATTLAAPTLAQSSTATYEVRFNATWSSMTHPGAYPGGAHFSPLVGATHDGSTHFWSPGGLATNGIEVMAETGSTGPLANEVGVAIGAGTAGELIAGPGLGKSASFSRSGSFKEPAKTAEKVEIDFAGLLGTFEAKQTNFVRHVLSRGKRSASQ